jgi:hypothetical protein
MRVDRQGHKIQNGWFYTLRKPNPWAKELIGRVWWNWRRANYIFEPINIDDIRQQESYPLNFRPLEDAVAVKQDERLVKLKRKPEDAE